MEHQKIDELVTRIKALESELEAELHQEYEKFTCEISKKSEDILASYRKERQGVLRYLVTAPILHLLSVPIIWSVMIPALILDAFVSFYQWVCFPIYKITKVKRSDYIVVDRHRLGYLNSIEKLNCLYCSYFNGLMGYITEIAARTEQYWCPIRHAARVKSMHNNYKKFFDYGDSENFRQRIAELREDLKEERE
jgi:hypothetical protein